MIRGLKGLTFVDKTDGMKEKVDRVSNCLPVNLFTGKTILLELLVTVLIGYNDDHLMTLSFTCFISF